MMLCKPAVKVGGRAVLEETMTVLPIRLFGDPVLTTPPTRW